MIKEVKVEIYLPNGSVKPIKNALDTMRIKTLWETCEGSNCKLEFKCKYDILNDVIKIIKEIHPYDTPDINIIPLITLKNEMKKSFISELELRLHFYEMEIQKALERKILSESTARSYVDDSNNFVKWCKGELRWGENEK